MEEITFSIFDRGISATDKLRVLVLQFEKETGVRVHLEIIPSWALGWTRSVETALYRNGPDISEVGNSWVGDLARMEALHSFKQEEVIEITKAAQIIDNLWSSRIKDASGSPVIYSIPWTGDTRAIFYRCDLLEQVGIDIPTAFDNTDHFDKTVAFLMQSGISMPLTITTLRSSLTIHYIASWIWSAGGDFLSPDGTRLTFHRFEALQGCLAYFYLGKYLGANARLLSEEESNQAFRSGKAAVSLNGYWMLNTVELSPIVRKHLGVFPMPGIPFVGGQDLVIWNYSHHKPAAIRLIQFLHSVESTRMIYPLYGLPVSKSGWEIPPFTTGFYPIFKQAIEQGRGFSGELWGLVEKRLTDEYADIWAEIFKSPENQMEKIVKNHLKNLAHRLELSMGA